MAQSPSYGLLRLRSKDAQSAIVQKLASDFNLTPIIPEAFYSQIALYFQEHANVSLSSGEVAYEAVAADEPAGKHIRGVGQSSKCLRAESYFSRYPNRTR